MRIISVHQLINDEQNKYSIDFRRNNIIIEKDDGSSIIKINYNGEHYMP